MFLGVFGTGRRGDETEPDVNPVRRPIVVVSNEWGVTRSRTFGWGRRWGGVRPYPYVWDNCTRGKVLSETTNTRPYKDRGRVVRGEFRLLSVVWGEFQVLSVDSKTLDSGLLVIKFLLKKQDDSNTRTNERLTVLVTEERTQVDWVDVIERGSVTKDLVGPKSIKRHGQNNVPSSHIPTLVRETTVSLYPRSVPRQWRLDTLNPFHCITEFRSRGVHILPVIFCW